MIDDLQVLSAELHSHLLRGAREQAAGTIAGQADRLAIEIESGALPDRGGAEALRLLAAIVRRTSTDALGPVGHG